ncbi:hypothetical protein OPIT5_28620 [Opitutaceae bacterium TAV5]|nr:hypothetical protein OPIT5_28620 [Opitutaceae bacterium TAV5]
MGGEAKRDYPASISFQSPWHREYKVIETYFSRLHVLLQAGEPLCDVLVVHPVESLWAQIHAGWATWLRTVDSRVQHLEDIYRKVFTCLSCAQIDFDYGDEEHLARRASIIPCSGTLAIGPMRYRMVIVAGMETMRATTVDLLRRFHEEGGTVIFAGPPPTHVDALPSPAVEKLKGKCVHVPLEENALVLSTQEASEASRTVLDERGRGLLCQARRDGGMHIIVLLNPSETREYPEVVLSGNGPVVEFDCLAGVTYAVDAHAGDRCIRWKTAVRPLQERVFVCGTCIPQTLPGRRSPPVPENTVTVECGSGYDYTLDEPNIAVLDMAEFSVGEEVWESRREILQVEQALCQRSGVPLRGGMMVQPWANEKKNETKIPIRIRFVFDIVVLPAVPVRLMIEQPERHQLFLNGVPVPVPEKTDWFIDPCFRTFTLPEGVLREGKNDLVMHTTFGDGTDLEAVYLLGEFGVEIKHARISLRELPARLFEGDWTQQGLPFYSGRIALRIPADGTHRLLVDPMGAATLVCRHPMGAPRRIMPWKPFSTDLEGFADANGFVVVEWVLTRRNTFGPLHLVPMEQDSIDPQRFRSTDPEWSDDYQLVPVGLAQPPRLRL